MLIQFILIVILVLIIVRSLWQWQSKKITGREFGWWLVIWLVAIIIIARPNIASFLAIKVGVTRGVDLVVYVSIIVIFYLLFRLLMRQEKIDKEITKIVSALALKDKKDD